MKKNKGFSLVELLVVIAIVAVLATVSVIGYTSYIKNANISNDRTVVEELNFFIEAVDASNNINTTTDAANEINKSGFDLTTLENSASGYHYAFDVKNKKFCLLDENYELKEYTPSNKHNIFVFIKNEVELEDVNKAGFSAYLQKDFKYKDENVDKKLLTNKGIDVGVNDVSEINYVNDVAQDVVIYTKGANTILVVDAEYDSIYHYGQAGYLNIIKVGESTYREYGYIPQGQIFQGRIINESGSVFLEDGSRKQAGIENLFLVASNENSFAKIIVGAVSGASLPNLDRTAVSIPSGGVLVVEVQDIFDNEVIDNAYIYLYKSGVKEQIIVSDVKLSRIEGSIKDNTVKGILANNEEVNVVVGTNNISTVSLKKAAIEVANILKGGDHSLIESELDRDDLEVESKASLNDLELAKGDNAKFKGGSGTKNNPYLISNESQYLNIKNGSEDRMIYYKFTDDFIINNRLENVSYIQIDGNKVHTQVANEISIIGKVSGHVILKNIDIYGNHEGSGNYSQLYVYGLDDKTTLEFIDCDNYCSITNSDRAGIYVGYMYGNDDFAQLAFIDCDNYADVRSSNGYVSMLVSNPFKNTYTREIRMHISNCHNYGAISTSLDSGKCANLISAVDNKQYGSEIVFYSDATFESINGKKMISANNNSSCDNFGISNEENGYCGVIDVKTLLFGDDKSINFADILKQSSEIKTLVVDYSFGNGVGGGRISYRFVIPVADAMKTKLYRYEWYNYSSLAKDLYTYHGTPIAKYNGKIVEHELYGTKFYMTSEGNQYVFNMEGAYATNQPDISVWAKNGENEVLQFFVSYAKDQPVIHHHIEKEVLEVEATCNTEGYSSYIVCEECGAHLTEPTIIPKLSHQLSKTEAIEASYDGSGNIEYWTCSVCHKHFSDKECNHEVAENSLITWATTTFISLDINGYYLNTTKGTTFGDERAIANYSCSDFIPVDDNTIIYRRTKNNVKTSLGNVYIGLYDENKKCINCYIINDYDSVETINGHNNSLKIYEYTDEYKNVRYIRISTITQRLHPINTANNALIFERYEISE